MYYKILKSDMKHHDMQYREGLNVNEEKTLYNANGGHGLYFADETHILNFTECGDLIAEVTLPENEIIISCNNECKAHRIILSNIQPLWNEKTFEALIQNGVNTKVKQEEVLRTAAAKGLFFLVKLLTENGSDIHILREQTLYNAAANGHSHVVKYLVEQGAEIAACNGRALQIAAQKGYFDMVKYLLHNDTMLPVYLKVFSLIKENCNEDQLTWIF